MNAPKIHIGTVAANPGELISLPVWVSEDCEFNAMSLCMPFLPAKCTFLRIEKTDVLPGEVYWFLRPTPGNIWKHSLMVAWNTPEANLQVPAGTILFYIVCHYTGKPNPGDTGNTAFKFRHTPGNDQDNCEWAAGIPSTKLNDEPYEEYYFPGWISEKTPANSGW